MVARSVSDPLAFAQGDSNEKLISFNRGTMTHKFGITYISFYPFDYNAFLSSSYDHTLKIYSSDSLTVSGSFELGSIVYAHAMSPVASHLLVACATQHPNVRLVDLRSGHDIQALAGHQSAVLALAWSPKNEHILASGGVDGTVRLWDVRRSSPNLCLLDMEDFVGVVGHDGLGSGASPRLRGKAHSSVVNGLSWTDNGNHIVTAGHDNRVRVWDAATGANTLVSFGPTVKNTRLVNRSLLISPTSALPPGKELLFYPNEQEILIFKLHEGKLVKRLKVSSPMSTSSRTGERNVRNSTTGLAWRGPADGIVSGHLDGQIRAWAPRTREDEDADADAEDSAYDGEEVRNKRKALDDIFRDLTRPKITFT
jgi:DNA excision repair protein ERCC-8